MCRLFGQIAAKEENAAGYLAEVKFSLLKQSDCDKKRLQRDGWGIGYWRGNSGRDPRRGRRSWGIVKSEQPLFSEGKRFREIAARTQSPIIIAHVRNASNPRKLSRKRLIGIKNSQPFSFQNLIFVHNGTLNIPDAVAQTLGVYRRSVRGTNDSEVLFWLFVKTWFQNLALRRQKKIWQKVFSDWILHVRSVWKSAPKRKFRRPFHGLNCIVSDGECLAALCYPDPSEGQSLCGQGRPYFEMCYAFSPGRIAIASEPMDASGRWKPIPKQHLLVVNRKLKVETLTPIGRL